ncbi:hypothetical protein ISF_05213 [Cordyceps fumosorosea ARSEF 2679]|uniref:Uncharacterized protein n=1 Tax=Cordyceps fumosorosea (strain ARSEF 2679) TaxID=1081104 RepID=A0A167V421_CORFA|nr:hypothetical protein ISF_05213 [Cordyceps fumosorosea ARSEF 2679]OAA62204.1 hypothetical protein ISF_05213 [Cordyceps fumosorosea ARSEF 2679]
MDSSSLGLAWGRFSSHRRARSSDISAPGSDAALPLIAVTSNGTRYLLPSEDATTTTSPLLLKPPSVPQHSRSKSWSTSKEKNHEFPSSYKAALSLPTNPLSSLRRAASSAKRSHKTSSSISSSSISSSWSTSLHGSSSSIDIPAPQKSSPLTSAASTPPQRPPRPPCGLFEDEPDASPPGVEDDDPMMQGLMLKSDQAFAAVGLALADAAYSTHMVTQAAALPTVMRSRSVLLPQKGLGFLASPTTTTTQSPAPLRRGPGGPLASRPVRRNSLQSSHSTSSNNGHGAARPQPSATTKTKKMGKRNVMLPRKLRLTTITQSVNELLANRTSTAAAAAKRRSAGSLSSTYSDYTEEDNDQPSHKRNSSITAARRQHRRGTSFALCATDDEGTLTASQMYHREMLPNSVAAWMGTDSALADEDDAADDQAPGHESATNEYDFLVTSPNLPIQPPPPPTSSAENNHAAGARSLSVEGGGSSLPPLPPPPPPPKNPARFGARARTSHLSPIPEMLVATPPAEGQRRRRKSSVKISPKSKRGSGGGSGGANRSVATTRDSLYLVGTAYSQTSPLFRHGHIEFQHKGKVKAAGDEECEEVVGDGQHLDWPAFHSSVLCDADDLEAGFAQDEADAMADELGDWFDEFGFESHGTLIRGSCVVPAGASSGYKEEGNGASRAAAARSTASSRSSASTISDAELPMPASPDRSPSLAKMQGWSFAQAERHDHARRYARGADPHASDPIPVAVEEQTSPRGLGLNTYGLPQGGGQGEAARASKLGGPSRGPRMSCNLSDDLGQFLAWNPTAFHDLEEDDQ